MSKHATLVGEAVEEDRVPVPESAVVLPDWLRIVDDPNHPGDPDWFRVEADFNISSMPDAIDHEIERKCCIEKLFAITTVDLRDWSDPSSEGVNRKIEKTMLVHKGRFLGREECILRAVPILTQQRSWMLGLVERPEPPAKAEPAIDTSNHYCLFY